LVDEVDAAADGGAESEAVVSPVDIVVHRLGNGDDLGAGAVEAHGERQRVIAADRDDGVEPKLANGFEDARSRIDRRLADRDLESRAQAFGNLLSAHL